MNITNETIKTFFKDTYYNETGIKEIDEIFSGFMEKESWNIFDGNTKDLPGVFYCNNFHDNNQYINIDNFKNSEYTLSHITKNLDNISDLECYRSLYEFYYSCFGSKWVDDLIVPFFYNIWASYKSTSSIYFLFLASFKNYYE